MQPVGFYIGKKGAVYAQLENGSLARLGLRVTGGKLVAFDPLRRGWIELPTHIPDRSGGSVTITVTEKKRRDPIAYFGLTTIVPQASHLDAGAVCPGSDLYLLTTVTSPGLSRLSKMVP